MIGVDSDGDVKVEIAGNRWQLNPLCCVLESAASQSCQSNVIISEEDGKNPESSTDGQHATGGRKLHHSSKFCTKMVVLCLFRVID